MCCPTVGTPDSARLGGLGGLKPRMEMARGSGTAGDKREVEPGRRRR